MTERDLDIALAAAGSLAAAALFHLASARSDAAWVVAALVPWGLVVGLRARGEVRLRTAVFAALGMRLLQVGTPPLLSDDLYRYLFEGRVLLAGENPFVDAPATLAWLEPALAARVNHPTIPSIYPPVAQIWFRLLALVGPGAWVAQLATTLVDTANVVLIHHLRRRDRRTTWPALVYALHPLAVLESGNGAHLEPLAVLFSLATVLLLRERPRLAIHALTAGVGVKLLPVLFVPAALRNAGWRPGLLHLALAAGWSAMLALPVLDAGPSLFEAFGNYRDHWSFNGLVFPLLEPWATSSTRAWLALGGLAVAAWAAALSPVRAWYVVATGFLVLSPTVHPWYVLWAFVPALLLGRRDWVLGAIALQSSYLVLATLDPATGAWSVPWWLAPLTWGGVLLGFVVDYARRLARPTSP